jgi:hypothetical protein
MGIGPPPQLKRMRTQGFGGTDGTGYRYDTCARPAGFGGRHENHYARRC